MIKYLRPFCIALTLFGSLAPGFCSDELSGYILGPEDTLTIQVLNEDVSTDTPYPVDLQGNISLPRIGKVHAAGLTVDQLQAEICKQFSNFLTNPAVTISVADFKSQPVSVLGAVDTPGVHQVRGRKTILEVLSEAGGLKEDAGDRIELSRRKQWGAIPLPGEHLDASGQFSVAEIDIRSVMQARHPEQNILVKPNDVITVPKAALIYVIGAVNRSGGFMLNERPTMSLLQVLSLANGLQRTANSSKAKILRSTGVSSNRTEIPLDIKKILTGKEADFSLVGEDILFVPSSTTKIISSRAIEALVQTGSGVMIYSRY